jgi:ubiquinone/menaquinone biosynthesis C-methylase UbiE
MINAVRRIKNRLWKRQRVRKFHFIEDYRYLVRTLLDQLPVDEAMSRAVGGNSDYFGEVEKQILIRHGLRASDTLVDIGCGSGRLARALVPYLSDGVVWGTDVVQELLDYAKKGCPTHWQFKLVQGIKIPFPDDSADFVCFFSVFTHLLHEETYCYLLEARRVMKPGARIVFSFLEYDDMWSVFQKTYENTLSGKGNDHLNMFIGRDAIQAWASHLGMEIIHISAGQDKIVELSRPATFDDGRRVEGLAALGQSLCVMRKA